MRDKFSRRHFIGGAVATSVAAQAATGVLPTRVLGKTGVEVTILAQGCGSRLLMYEQEDKAAEAIHLSLERGVRYFDTAQAYGNGKSETWVGKALKGRRDEVFLATKIRTRDHDEALREMDRSLERLQTNHVDLLHCHNLWYEDDLAAVEKGILKVLYRMRDEKVARFIGVTSHVDPKTLATALERHDFDCTQMALNAALQGRSTAGENLPPVPANSFERVALPVARRKNLGILAMKVAAQDSLLGDGHGKSTIDPLLRYTLSLPVAAAVVGMPKLDFIRHNTGLARNFTAMPKAEMDRFSRRMSEANKTAIDSHFRDHEDV
ncbi:MAG: aldo/keto reductase [Acidobacteria bacterium]|nr:aldo/keto reductase [Acidobacteriota bacterium]